VRAPTPLPLRRNRDFLLLQTGQVLSSIGSESTAIAYPLVVLAVTHSPAKAGIVGFARVLPWGLFGFIAGVAVDRLHRKRVMLTSDVVRAAAMTSIVVALALGKLTFAQIAIVAFVEGSMYVFFNVAEIAALRSVVATQQLPVAAAAEQARYSTVTIVAPPLGGALFGVARALPFLADAVSYAFSFGSLVAIRTPFQEERERDETPLRMQLAEGFRWLWRHPFLRACALLFACTNPVYGGLFLTLIVVGRRQGLSGGEIGALIAAFGACSLAGSALAPLLQRVFSMRAIVLASFWITAPVVAFVAHPSVYVLLVSVLPSAVLLPTVNAVVVGYRVAIVPDRLTGRVNSVARTIALCSTPLGPLAAGFLLGAFSARTTIAAFAAFLFLLALIATASPSLRHGPSLAELEELPPRAPDLPGAPPPTINARP
jgi:MFS family permease